MSGCNDEIDGNEAADADKEGRSPYVPRLDPSVYAQILNSSQLVSEAMKPIVENNRLVNESMRRAMGAWKERSAWAEELSASMRASFFGLSDVARGCSALLKEIDLSGICAQLERIAGAASRVAYVDKLSRAKWPLYFVNDEELLEGIYEIDSTLEERCLSNRISQIAFERLDNEWAEKLAVSWRLHDELGAGRLALLNSSLLRYEDGDYEGCVCILMSLLEGLLDFYYVGPTRLTGREAEAYARRARGLGLNRVAKDGRVLLGAAKDRLLMLLMSSDGAGRIWEAAVSYVLDVVLSNSVDEDLMAHNPLRNKICHGAQTDYGTREHALKAILVTDIVMELGRLSQMTG